MKESKINFEELPDRILITSNFVSLTGSYVAGEDHNDHDVIVRQEKRDEGLELTLAKVIGDDEHEAHFIYSPTGPRSDYIALYDLVLVRKDEPELHLVRESMYAGSLRRLIAGLIAEGELKVDLGCGENKPEGYFGIDEKLHPGVDLVWQIADTLPFPDDSVSEFRAHHFLEHLSHWNVKGFMQEIWRSLKPNGKLNCEIPSTDGPGAFANPDHQSFWNRLSFGFFCDDELRKSIGFQGKFEIEKITERSEPKSGAVYVNAILKAVK